MTLYITSSNGKTTEWHVGEPSPNRLTNEILIIQCVQADEDELTHVCCKFDKIPRVYNAKVVRWFGETAQFIVANL